MFIDILYAELSAATLSYNDILTYCSKIMLYINKRN